MKKNTSRFNWPDLIQKIPGWITGFIAFVTAVVGFVKLVQGDTGLVTIVPLAIGVGGGWLGCLYVHARKRDTGRIVRHGGKKPREVMVPYYGKWERRLALAGLVIIPLLTAGGVVYHRYQQVRPPTKVIILVADFNGPEPSKYRVTETLLARLRAALERYDDVQIEALGRAITEAEGSAAARAEGEKCKAAIVIWGWYGVTAEAVPLSVHFEVLRPPERMPELGPEVKGLVQTMTVAELESFTLQTKLSAEMAYLSLFTVGMARYAAEDWDEAIACFGDALNQTAEHTLTLDRSTIHFRRGTAYHYKGEYDQAIADYDEAIELKPDYVEAYNNRGVVYGIGGDHERAIVDLDKAIELKPDYAEAYYNRGVAYYHKGEYDQALAALDRAVELKPDYATAYYGRGIVYAYKGEYDLAIADYDKAIELKSDYVEAYNNRGNAYHRRGEYDLAIADYDKVIELDPDHIEVYNNRGVAYAHMGEYDQAVADYDKAIELKSDYVEAYNNRGNAYYHKGEYDHAIADCDRAIELKPDYPSAYYNRGVAYMLRGNNEEAIRDFERFLELSEDEHWRKEAEKHLRELRGQ